MPLLFAYGINRFSHNVAHLRSVNSTDDERHYKIIARITEMKD